MLCSDEQILEFLVVLDTLKIGYEKCSGEGNSYEFNYEYTDNIIKIDSGWYAYEEGCDNNYIITLNEDSIECKYTENGSCVYGDIDCNVTNNYKSLEDLGIYLIKYFNIDNT